jgi:protein-S-isoprenylcysteine O-methyltransferase Ste14
VNDLLGHTMNPTVRFVFAFITITLLFFLILPAAILVSIQAIDSLLNLPAFPPTPYNYLVAIPLFAFGWFWVAWSNLSLLKIGKGTSLEVAGRGVNVTQKLVVVGPYSYIRNPMVFGYFIAFSLGLSVLFHSLAGLLVCPVALIIYGVYLRRWEERGLVARFGEDYVAYRRQVPMFIPIPWRKYRKV